MNHRSVALCLAGVLLAPAVRAESPFNPAGAWPTANSGPGPAPDLKLNQLPLGKLLVLGKQHHDARPAPGIGWTGDWGMAASSADKDFVHRLAAHIAEATGGQPKWMSRNIADFERGHPNYDIAAGMKDELAFQPDVVIVAIGENVPALGTDEAKAAYRDAFVRLLGVLKENSHPLIVVRSSFWPNAEKDEPMKQAAAQAGAIWVDVGALGRDPANAARSERKIEHDGVAGHPGDRGMQALADALWAAIERQAAGEKTVMAGGEIGELDTLAPQREILRRGGGGVYEQAPPRPAGSNQAGLK